MGNVVAEDDSDVPALPQIPADPQPVTPPLTFSAAPQTRIEAVPTDDRAAGTPRVLAVDRLGIEVPVLPIQVEGGVLEPPANPREVGWDVDTAQAGLAYGGTVITGHTVHTGGGALDELDDLEVGDTVVVGTARGRIEYVVRHVLHITKAQMVRRLPKLYRHDVLGRLVLITCTDWNGVDYDANTVVTARPES